LVETTTPVPVNSPCPILSEADNVILGSPDAKEKENLSSHIPSPIAQKFTTVSLDCVAARRNEKVYIWNRNTKK